MSPVEAVARALDPGAWRAGRVGDGTRRDAALAKARAALTALRDNGVTEGMWLAWLEGGGRGRAQATCDKEFRAMLDAALKGE